MYDPAKVDLARVVAPPYDVISPKDQLRYYEQDPHNVVRLIAGEVRATDSAEDNKYLRAAAFFNQWFAEGVLRQEPGRSEEHTSELQSPYDLVCRLLLEKKKHELAHSLPVRVR